VAAVSAVAKAAASGRVVRPVAGMAIVAVGATAIVGATADVRAAGRPAAIASHTISEVVSRRGQTAPS